jgi:IS30 family transposase
VGALSYEIKKNTASGIYAAATADHKAYVSRRASKYQGKKIVHDSVLKKEVDWRLMDDQSPEAVARRISRREKHLPSISKDSIYRYIASVYGRRIETHRFLKKQRRRVRRPKVTQLEDRTFIDKRPSYINKRSRVGDAEFDFIVSGKTGKGILLVVVDRKLRTSFLEKVFPVSIPNVERAALRIKKRYPEWKTGTTDNDLLFRHHKRLEKLLGITIYFCHQYHSWEKGTVENTNKVIRRDVPKGSDISKRSKYFIGRLEEKLNRRPMKCLKYKTPQEVLNTHRKRILRNKKPLGARVF